MFTGIVQTLGQISALTPSDAGQRLTVTRAGLRGEVVHGDSICVSGICLTAVDITPDHLGFDVIHETLAKTKLGKLSVGDAVNLEPAVTPSQPLGGHFMQGHVDGLAVVDAIHTDGGAWRISFRPEKAYADLMRWIIPRGSIAIDGVSLTLARVEAETFDVALIPATLEMTTLGKLKVGDRVNIEADILAKTVVHQLERMQGEGGGNHEQRGDQSGVTLDLLRHAGFVG